MSLTKNALSGLFWTVIDTVFLKGSIFIASIILARLLGPTEFGLVGMISVFISIGLVIVNSGLSSSLIRAKKTDESDYNTVFFLSLSISVCIFIFFYILAPYIAKFYKQQILSEVIKVYCIGFVISAFSAVQQAIFEKNMQFKKLMLLNAPGTLLGVFVGIALGILGYGVWSIVFMHLSTRLITSIMFWLFCSWKPAFQFSASKMKYHFSFGYKLLFSGLIDISFNNIYNVIIGKFFTVQSLGHFERARTFTEYPVTMLTGILDKVTYPLLSKIQDEKERVAEVYKQLLQFSFFVTAPIMFGAAAIAFPLFELILGKQWLQAAGYFQIICLASMFYPVHAFNINILKVYGRTDLFLKLEIIKKICLVLGVVVAFPFGIEGLAWSAVFTSCISLVINMYYSSDLIYYTTIRQIKDMLPTLLTGILSFLLMYGLVSLFGIYSLYVQIIGALFLGISFYVTSNTALKTMPLSFAIRLIKQRNL